MILHNQGVSVGGEIIDSIRSLFHVPGGSQLEMENLRAYFGAVGLGTLLVTGDLRAMKVTIENPVMSGQKTPVVDQFLVGVVRGAVMKVFSGDYVVQDLTYDQGKIRFGLVPARKNGN